MQQNQVDWTQANELENTFQAIQKQFKFQDQNAAKLLKDKLLLYIDQINGYTQMNLWFLPLKSESQVGQSDVIEQVVTNYKLLKHLRDLLDEELKKQKSIINQICHNLIQERSNQNQDLSIVKIEEMEKKMLDELTKQIQLIKGKVIEIVKSLKEVFPQSNFNPQNMTYLYYQSMLVDIDNYSQFLQKMQDVYITFWIDVRTIFFSITQFRQEAPYKQNNINNLALEFHQIYERDQIDLIKPIVESQILQSKNEIVNTFLKEILIRTIKYHKVIIISSDNKLDENVQKLSLELNPRIIAKLMQNLLQLCIHILQNLQKTSNIEHLKNIFNKLQEIFNLIN